MKNNKSNPMWGGHYKNSTNEIMQEINASISFDKKLYKQDIKASIIHCKMLQAQKIISPKEGQAIISGLEKIEKEITDNKFNFKIELEDIHMNIEFRLKEIIGDIAGKLHTARSRNDQVATDFKIYIKEANIEIINLLKDLVKTLHKKATENLETIMPGFTHLQAAQPISFAHYCHAYIEMFKRDISRFNDATARADESPLGSAALAGTSFPIDRKLTAKLLGFKTYSKNSIDAVSDRDFALDFLSNSSICMTHLSRIAEELIIWMSQEFSFVKLSDEFTTGSSIMPQKRNPDAAELIRGKTGRINGNLIALLTTMKALPLSYSKDMQEDKEPVFDSHYNMVISLKILTKMIENLTINKENMLNSCQKGYLTATDLADYLVKEYDLPFREAHKLTGKIIALAEDKNCKLEELELEEFKKINTKIDKNIYDIITITSSLKSRNSLGGTAPKAVEKALKEAIKNL
jgi:argininosuccinate lyase